MERRTWLASLSGISFGGLAGCLDDGTPRDDEPDEGTPMVNVEDIEFAPGEDGTLSILANNAGNVHLSERSDSDAVVVDATGDVEFSIPRSGGDDSDQPYWNWGPPDETVEIGVPTRAEGDADPGTDRGAVTAWHVDVREQPREDAESVAEEFTITVAGG
jgi:hypothetical protein